MIALGVRKGIERSAKVLMPLLFVVLIALSVHSLLLPGGGEGLRFFFRPDFSQVTPSTVLVALGQAFFSLSISIGTMVTYASYFKPDTDLRHTALNVTILDTLVAVLAGVVIFPAVFSVGIAPSSGPSLVFITPAGHLQRHAAEHGLVVGVLPCCSSWQPSPRPSHCTRSSRPTCTKSGT